MNDHRRRLFHGVDGQIAFLCECVDESCTSSVLLAPEEFDRARATGEPVVHDGHTPAGG